MQQWSALSMSAASHTHAEVGRKEGGPRQAEDLRRRVAELEQELARREHTERALREQVSALTAQNAELAAQNAELTALNADLDAFAGHVAHDLRSPLSVIVSYTNMLRWAGPRLAASDLLEVLPDLDRAARTGIRLVDDLLLLARLRSGPAETAQPVDLELLALSALQRVRPMAEAAGAEIVMAEQWPQALAYAPWVEAVWVNYLSNAIKYGGRPPRLRVGAELHADGMVRCWVQDNGQGLAPEQQARLFTPFTRLHGSAIEGHGLGLALVRALVEKQGGAVGLESTLGVGTTFFFTLPACC